MAVGAVQCWQAKHATPTSSGRMQQLQQDSSSSSLVAFVLGRVLQQGQGRGAATERVRVSSAAQRCCSIKCLPAPPLARLSPACLPRPLACILTLSNWVEEHTLVLRVQVEEATL